MINFKLLTLITAVVVAVNCGSASASSFKVMSKSRCSKSRYSTKQFHVVASSSRAIAYVRWPDASGPGSGPPDVYACRLGRRARYYLGTSDLGESGNRSVSVAIRSSRVAFVRTDDCVEPDCYGDNAGRVAVLNVATGKRSGNLHVATSTSIFNVGTYWAHTGREYALQGWGGLGVTNAGAAVWVEIEGLGALTQYDDGRGGTSTSYASYVSRIYGMHPNGTRFVIDESETDGTSKIDPNSLRLSGSKHNVLTWSVNGATKVARVK